ncbi:MAG TPA: hypothetical protein VMD29_12855, partial [Terracidiphilus sp.]|nr:hypothetical protein [Terracidiphilus sp.]
MAQTRCFRFPRLAIFVAHEKVRVIRRSLGHSDLPRAQFPLRDPFEFVKRLKVRLPACRTGQDEFYVLGTQVFRFGRPRHSNLTNVAQKMREFRPVHGTQFVQSVL